MLPVRAVLGKEPGQELEVDQVAGDGGESQAAKAQARVALGLLAQPQLGDDGEVKRGDAMSFLDAEAQAAGPPDVPVPFLRRPVEVAEGLGQAGEQLRDRRVIG